MIWRKQYTGALTLGFASIMFLHMCGFAWLQAWSLCLVGFLLIILQPLRGEASLQADSPADTSLAVPVSRFVPFTCSIRIDIDACLQKLEIAEEVYHFVGTRRFASVFATATVIAYGDYSGFGSDPLFVLKREIDSEPRYSTHLELRWEVETADFNRNDYSMPELNRAFPHLLRIILIHRKGSLQVALGYPERWAHTFLPADSPRIKKEPVTFEFDYIYRVASVLPWQVFCSFLEVQHDSNPKDSISNLEPQLSSGGWALDCAHPLSLKDGCVDYYFSAI